jgi:hypothetical protein
MTVTAKQVLQLINEVVQLKKRVSILEVIVRQMPDTFPEKSAKAEGEIEDYNVREDSLT